MIKKKNFLNQYYKLFPRKFGDYWNKIKNSSNIDEDLNFITNNFINSKSYNLVSRYWHILGIRNYESLAEFGLKKYGSTVARNYYGFFELFDDWVEGAMDNLKDDDSNSVNSNLFKKQNNFSYKESIFYNYLCLLLYYNLKKTKYFKNLLKLQDKTYLGFDDPFIKIEETNVTVDKLVSLLDCEKIDSAFTDKKFTKYLEIGAGSGRTSEAIMSLNDNINYVICDIPPALYISYKRLKLAFPNKRIKLLIDIEDKVKLEKEINSSDISFIFPHQLKNISNKFFDITLAIDCMHEMDKATINYYWKVFNNISKNIYFSIWNIAFVPYSKTFFKKQNRLNYELGDYSIPINWKLIYKKNLVFPSNFLALGYINE